jgi:hypothetical protein
MSGSTQLEMRSQTHGRIIADKDVAVFAPVLLLGDPVSKRDQQATDGKIGDLLGHFAG